MKEEGEGGALCEEKGDAANAARLQVLAAGGAPEPIRPTSVHKSGRTHTLALSLSLLSISLSIFFPPLFFFLSLFLSTCAHLEQVEIFRCALWKQNR